MPLTPDAGGTQVQIQGPPGEMSVWSDITGTGPFTKVNQLQTSGGGIQPLTLNPLQVLNWAEEVNGNQSVPIGLIVWMRCGENYLDKLTMTPRDDYTFLYQLPIYAKILGRHKQHDSDPAPDNLYMWIEAARAPLTIGGDAQSSWESNGTVRQSVPATNTMWIDDDQASGLKFAALEINGDIGVPLCDGNGDTIVRLSPGQVLAYDSVGNITDQEWLFDYNGDQSPEWADYLTAGSATGNTITSMNMTLQRNTLNIKIDDDNNISFCRPGEYMLVWSVYVSGTIPQNKLNGKAQTLQGELQSLNSACIPPPFPGVWQAEVPYNSGYTATITCIAGGHSGTSRGNFGESDITGFTTLPGPAVVACVLSVTQTQVPLSINFTITADNANTSELNAAGEILINRIDWRPTTFGATLP
jgi:hypothetical protein